MYRICMPSVLHLSLVETTFSQQPTKKPRSVGPDKSKPIQITKKATNNKKLHQKNRKSRSVTIQIPDDHRNKNKESRSDSTQHPEKPRSVNTQKNPMNTISDLEEKRSVKEDSTP